MAEDDPGVRTSLTRALGFQGYDVTAVNDGAAALEAVDRSLPDAVILDVSMPHVEERDVLYDRIWGFNFETGSRSLDVYIGYLRRKTEENGEPRVLHTVRGVGYVVRPPSDSDWEDRS
ncbi:MAG: winged helix family transcriptional regulator [Actinobacteria bacterium]|nr:winged helix family transcriptional regulator [Actinomycetota bacterium]